MKREGEDREAEITEGHCKGSLGLLSSSKNGTAYVGKPGSFKRTLQAGH